MPPVDGYLLFDKAKFPASFAGDVSPEKAAFNGRLASAIGCERPGRHGQQPAWKAKPGWK
jgi:hypothetical protein